jgi:hypothetical protein
MVETTSKETLTFFLKKKKKIKNFNCNIHIYRGIIFTSYSSKWKCERKAGKNL